ncbi:MAG: sarcosine oxidase subunit delta [Aestuariivita sp.]|nr:sarcosine oxidase subunit delta [Aestuariivita sp.]
MRIVCPICGERDSREFSCRGSAVSLWRPAFEASDDTWNDYVHLRENPAGESSELWHHEAGCSSWLVVLRDTRTHEVIKCELAEEVKSES